MSFPYLFRFQDLLSLGCVLGEATNETNATNGSLTLASASVSLSADGCRIISGQWAGSHNEREKPEHNFAAQIMTRH